MSDKTYIVDKKQRREVEKNRKTLRESDLSIFQEVPIKSLYFDGRKDESYQEISGHRKLAPDEHIALIEKPGSKYILSKIKV